MSDRTADRQGTRIPSRTRRRLQVATMYLCLAGYVGSSAFGGESWWILLFLVPLVVAVVIYSRLIVPINNEVAGRKTSELDERQLAVRDRAHHHAYHILGGLLLLALVYASWSSALGVPGGERLPMPRISEDLSTLLVPAIFLVASLPASVAAWIGPDPLPDEED